MPRVVASPILKSFHRRRVLRRQVQTRCQAVRLSDFALLGERVLDMSPFGLLVACDQETLAGDEVIVSFQEPRYGAWHDAEAKVVRVIEGYRDGDPGYSAGLRFTGINLESRLELHRCLRGFPPPVPARGLRADYAATVREILAS